VVDVQQLGSDTFRALSKSAALLISVAAALLLSWRGRAKWEPSEEDIPGALNQLARLLTAVTMVVILTQLTSAPYTGRILPLLIGSLAGCLISFFIYAYLTGTHTYRSGEHRFIMGFRLRTNVKPEPGETIVEYARRIGDPDKVWTAASRAWAKSLFALCYLGLNVLGSATLMLAVLTGPSTKEAAITYPAQGNGVQEQERLTGTSRNFASDEPPWIVVVPWDGQKFCPQGPVSVDFSGNWSLLVNIGLEHDGDKRFDLLIVGVDHAAAERFKAYLKTKVSVVYPGMDQLPPGSQLFGDITVHRQ
jgi:hypothetical protein